MIKLASSGRIGKLPLKNRIIMAPMGPHFGSLDAKAVEYFVRRAEGGAGMIMINMMITDYFEDASSSFVLTKDNLSFLKELVNRAHQYNCKICLQLMPGCGRISYPAKMYDVPISASACSWLAAPHLTCHELTVEEIKKLLDEMRRTAELAVEAGTDAFELHAYGGYLNDQFLTAAWNTRTDQYGGDVKGRASFLLEQAEIVRKAAGPDRPIIVKFCPDHGVPYPGMRQLNEGLELAGYLESCGIDALHVDAGCYEKWQLSMPPLFYQEAVLQLKSARAVKEAVSIPVITNGRLGDAAKAEAALTEGVCDFAAIGRGFLADPDLAVKISNGCPEEIRPCISCNESCIGNVLRGTHVACAVNPFTGYEDERKIVKTKQVKKVLVAGGGPGGCTAALLAKQAGHEVELWEKKARLGGKLTAAAAPFMKTDMDHLRQYYSIQLQKEGIPVRLFKEADRETIAEFAPDVLIWAAGGCAARPQSISGLNRSNVCSCADALDSLAYVGNRVVIIGGGQVGIEAAIHFERMGHAVTVVEMADKMMPEPAFIMNDTMLREMMAHGNTVYMTQTKLLEVNDEGAVVEGPGGRTTIPCDTVLLAMGWQPDAEEGKKFADICRVIPIGDSVQCRDILHATEEAYQAVMQINVD